MTLTIKPSELCKRLAFRHYFFFLMLFIPFYPIAEGYWPGLSFTLHIIKCSIAPIYFWGLMILVLYTLKPVGILRRFILMTGTLSLGFLIPYVGIVLIFDLVSVSLSGVLFSIKVFIAVIVNGMVMIGMLYQAERSLIAEKTYAEEKTGRILSEKQLVENRLNLLQAQIEPRFLFNTMKSISKLFDRAPEKAKAMQTYFIQYLRATLVKTRERITTIEQEMELIRSYLDIFKVSMGERLEYHFNIDPQTMDLTFPSMLLQPVVENAVKYGLEKNPEGGRISISVKKRDDMVCIEIADTGNGLHKEERTAIILSDVKERIRSLFGDQGQLQYVANNPSGLIVIIEVPYE